MKFAAQVASYQNKLRRKSRFFSSLMLVSGLGLAAAAPFLSLEVSKIECIEKGKAEPAYNNDELQSLKTELGDKEEAITLLEQKLEGQKDEINKLARNPDCDNLVRVITDERDRLDEELTEVTTASLAKDETITELESEVEEKDKEITDLTSNPDCDNLVRVVEKERDRLAIELREVTAASWIKDNDIERLREVIEECQEQLDRPADCSEFTNEIRRLEKSIITKDRTITQLRKNLEEAGNCPSIRLSGTLHHKEGFVFSGNSFRVEINRDDVGARFQFYRNNGNVTSQLNNGTYTFKTGGATYQFKLQGPKGDILPYTLTSL